MIEHLPKAIGLADKVVTMAEDGVSSLDLAIASWPAEFRAIIWEAVAAIATKRAEIARGKS